MAVTNPVSGTRIDEIAPDIYRISTPVGADAVPGGFSFNQYLVVDDAPLLFHTGLRRSFPYVCEAIARVVPLGRLRYVGFSHVEADECGALNEFLAIAAAAEPLCGRVAGMVSIRDMADRQPRELADGEVLSLGRHAVQWLDAPHLPHAWECGFLLERSSATLLCGDLFTQPGAECPPLTEGDILEPSEAFRLQLDYYSHTRNARQMIARLAALRPHTLACMHGSAWRGDGAALLEALGERLER